MQQEELRNPVTFSNRVEDDMGRNSLLLAARRCAVAGVFAVAACSHDSTGLTRHLLISPDRLILDEGRAATLTVGGSIRETDVQAGLLYWDLIDAPGYRPTIGVELLNDEKTAVRIWAFGADTAHIVVRDNGYPERDTALIMVRGVSAATLTLSPDTATVKVGAWVIISPIITDSVGWPLTRATLDWTTSDSAVATLFPLPGGGFSGSGELRVDAIRPGTTTITASVQNASGQAVVVVQP